MEKVLKKYLSGEAPPRGWTRYPSIYHFCQKRNPFRIPSTVKSTVFFREWINHIPLKVLLSCACYVGPFTDCNDRLPCPFIYFNKEPLIPTLSWNVGRFVYTQVDSPTRSKSFRQHSCGWSSISIKLKQVVPEAWKKYPFRAEHPRIGYYWEYPRASPSRLCGILHPCHESLIERKYNSSLRADVFHVQQEELLTWK